METGIGDNMGMISWRELIVHEANRNGDNLDSLLCTLSDTELDVKFDDGYGASEGKPFSAWTHSFVYFPVVYDGAEWVGSAPRNPCDVATEHQGGQ